MSLELKNISKSYNDELILDNINLTIKEGSVFGLLGPNGAGKSTLINILNSITRKDTGSISFFGKDFDNNTSYVRNNSSYVPQTYAFYPNLTAYENLQFFAALYSIKDTQMEDRIQYCINITSLEKYVNKKAETFSGGLKRRLNIAIGLLNNPKILYLDEPTVGIDPQSRNYILQMIKKINEETGITIIYTSHYMEEVEYLCDTIAILDNKKIILHDSKENLVKKNNNIQIILKNNETVIINVSESYVELINFLDLNKSNVLHINFENKTLEAMFLKLTKQDLRD